MKTVFSIFYVLAIALAIQVEYEAPAATSYVYRSDNGGPANLVQYGGHGYQQPQLFAPPLPLAAPVKAFEAYDLVAPLPYVATKDIAVDDAEEDEGADGGAVGYGDAGLTGLHHGGFEEGAGSDYGEQHHSAHGEKGIKGYKTKNHHAKGESGHYGKEHNEGYYKEDEGKGAAHYDEADAHGKHYSAGKGYKGGDHGHKKHFSKGEDVTGYHKVFHKDEYKKDHDFYDEADKSGHFQKHGYEKKHHGSEEGGHKKGGHIVGGHDKADFGKSGFYEKGHIDDADAGHSAEEGNDSHYEHHDDYGKKGGSSHEKGYGYGDGDGGNDGDDYDDSDEKK